MAKTKGSYNISEEIFDTILEDLIQGSTVNEVCDRYHVSRNALYLKLHRRGQGSLGNYVRTQRLKRGISAGHGDYHVSDEIFDAMLEEMIQGMTIDEACSKYQISKGVADGKIKKRGLGSLGRYVKAQRFLRHVSEKEQNTLVQ